MAIVGTIGGYFVYKFIRKIIGKGKKIVIAAFIAAWFSVVIASTVCAIELAISGTAPINIVLPAMAGVHAIIGIGEGIITLLVVSFVLKVRPDLIHGEGE
jgi:cobalt/nickel transport system permease protein